MQQQQLGGGHGRNRGGSANLNIQQQANQQQQQAFNSYQQQQQQQAFYASNAVGMQPMMDPYGGSSSSVGGAGAGGFVYFNHQMSGYPTIPMDPNQAAAMMASSGVYQQYGQHQQPSMLTNPYSQIPLQMYGAMPPSSFVPSQSMGIGMVPQQQQVGVSRSRAGSLNATTTTSVPMNLQSTPLVQIPFPDMMTTLMIDDAAIMQQQQQQQQLSGQQQQQHFGFPIGSQLNNGVGCGVVTPSSSIYEAVGISTTEDNAAVEPSSLLPSSSLDHQSDSTLPSFHLNHNNNNSSIIIHQQHHHHQQLDSSTDDLHRTTSQQEDSAPTTATVTSTTSTELYKNELSPLDGEEEKVIGGTETETRAETAGPLADQEGVVVADQQSSSTVLLNHQVDLSIDISSVVVGGGEEEEDKMEEKGEATTTATTTTTTTSIPQYSTSSSGKRVYSKTQLIALFPPDRSEAPHIIPATLRDFYPSYVYERGSIDGSDHVRYPLKGDYSSSSSIGGVKGDSSSRGGGGGGGGGGRPQSHRGGGGDSRGGGNNSSNSYSSRSNNQHNNSNSSSSSSNGSNRYRYERVGNESPAINDVGGTSSSSSSSYISDNTPAGTPVGYKPLFQMKTGDDDPEGTVRKANFILNKLSVTKYDKLSDEFLALLQEECVSAAKDGSEKLKRTVDALLSKAQMEESFCFMYADLCSKIITQWLTDIPVEAIGDAVSSSSTTTTSTTTSTTTVTEQKAAADTEENDSIGTESKDVGVVKEKDKDKDTEIDMVKSKDKVEKDVVKGKDKGEKDIEKNEEKEKVEKEEDKIMGRVFRTVLLSRCQAEFEFDHAKAIADIRSNLLWEAGEREEKEIIAKKRITGREKRGCIA